MNELDDTNGVSALDLDRLVDGELEESERVSLLERLEMEPAGWRRCAIAFLEAQAMRDVMSGFSVTAEREPAARGSQSPKSKTISRWRGPAMWLSAAAAFVLAFVAGWRLGGTHGFEDGPRFAMSAPGADPGAAEAAPSLIHASTSPEPADVAGEDAGYLAGLMRRHGYRMERESGFVPVSLDDGREIAVPVDRLRVRYVGTPEL
jgi:anti-sigma factor RsiW